MLPNLLRQARQKILSVLSALNIRAVKQQFRKIKQNNNVRLEVLVAVT